MLPAAGTVLLVAALAWAAVASAHHQAWLGGPPAWRHALRPTAAWTLPILAVLWAGALALYRWPRRHQRQPISLVALLSMVIVGVILARWPVPASQFERGHVACPGQPQAAGEEGPGAGPSRPGPASGDQSPGSVTGSPVAGG
jgi:hypothetical protein